MASENGAPSIQHQHQRGSNGTADQETANQSSFADDRRRLEFAQRRRAPPSSNSQLTSPSSKATSESGGSNGQSQVGIAAAVSVNVLTTSTVASIDNGLTVTSGRLADGRNHQPDQRPGPGQRPGDRPTRIRSAPPCP